MHRYAAWIAWLWRADADTAVSGSKYDNFKFGTAFSAGELPNRV